MIIYSVDTEDDSKGNVKLINFYNGKDHFSFKTPEDAIYFIYFTLQKQNKKIQIWATNLGYDLTNILYKTNYSFHVSYAGSRAISATITKNIKMYDTLNHWKISVAEMGKRIGLEKLQENLFDQDREPTFAELKERCKRDCEITYHFVIKMKEKYESIGAKLKATIGATSLDLFYKQNGEKPIYKNKFKIEQLEFMKNGLYGGRTECFFNKPVENDIYYIDINSLYPSVMYNNKFPYLDNYKFTKNPNLNNEGVIHVSLKCDDKYYVPYIPSRVNNELFFPIGEFSTHITYFELREALKLGYKLEGIHEAFEFQGGSFYPFRDFINDLYNQRLRAQAAGDILLSDTYKLIMNNLFGKFGQSNEKTTLLKINKNDLKENKVLELLPNNFAILKELGDYPGHTNYIWSAYVTAYARHKLFEKLNEVREKGGKILYCDTDSIFYQSKSELITTSNKLGEFKLEGKFKYAYFKGLKNYKLIDENDNEYYKVRGVPKKYAKLFFENGSATITKPYRLRESLRRNNSKNKKLTLIPNYWHEEIKQDKKIYSKRKVFKNGETKPQKFKQTTI